jgi:hypothetical protein
MGTTAETEERTVKLNVPRDTLEGVLRELEAHVAKELLYRMCPNYRLIKVQLAEPVKKTIIQRIKEAAV